MSQLSVNAAFFFTVPGPKMIWQSKKWDMISLLKKTGVPAENPSNGTTSTFLNENNCMIPMQNSLLCAWTNRKCFPQQQPAMESHRYRLEKWPFSHFIQCQRNKTSSRHRQFHQYGYFGHHLVPKNRMWYNYMDSSETLEVTSITMSVNVPANNFKIFSTFQP